MKKTLILIAVLMLAFVTSQAQTEKGTQTIGVNFQYFQSNYTNTPNPADNTSVATSGKSSTINLGPSYSYFIADKLDLGVSLNYGHNSYDYPQNNGLTKQINSTYGWNLYLRKYFMFTDKLGLRAGPYVYYNYSKGTLSYSANTAPDDHSTTKDYGGGLIAEFVYFPTKHLGFSARLANLSFDHSDNHDLYSGNTTSNNWNLALVNSGLAVSVQYSFGGK